MDKIGICGAGLIGASWAIGFANAGFTSFVYDNNVNSVENFNTVSYTHLTLPTICSV